MSIDARYTGEGFLTDQESNALQIPSGGVFPTTKKRLAELQEQGLRVEAVRRASSGKTEATEESP